MAKTLKEMDGFIWEMLSLTKDYELEPEKVDLGAILAELQSDLSERAERYHIKLDFKAVPIPINRNEVEIGAVPATVNEKNVKVIVINVDEDFENNPEKLQSMIVEVKEAFGDQLSSVCV